MINAFYAFLKEAKLYEYHLKIFQQIQKYWIISQTFRINNTGLNQITVMTALVRYFLGLWSQFQQNRIRRLGRKADQVEEQGFRQQWFLLAGSATKDQIVDHPKPQNLTAIYPPDNAFWADPFVWVKDGKRYVFFEDFPFDTWRGRISVIVIDEMGQRITEPVPVVDETHHLSYPFLFEYQGELYMMPEKAEVKRVDLYRCVEFPFKWEFHKTLIDGVKIADRHCSSMRDVGGYSAR